MDEPIAGGLRVGGALVTGYGSLQHEPDAFRARHDGRDCNGLVTITDALVLLRGMADLSYPVTVACPKVGDIVQVR